MRLPSLSQDMFDTDLESGLEINDLLISRLVQHNGVPHRVAAHYFKFLCSNKFADVPENGTFVCGQ